MPKEDSAEPPTSLTEEMKDDCEKQQALLCKVCDMESVKHVTFITCTTCCEQYSVDQMFTLIRCGHEYCQLCVKAHLE